MRCKYAKENFRQATKTSVVQSKDLWLGLGSCNLARMAITLVYTLFIVSTFAHIDADSHSASDTLIGVFPRFVIATLLLIWICCETGEKPAWRWGTKKR